MKKTIHNFLQSYTVKPDKESLFEKIEKSRNELDSNISKIKLSDMKDWSRDGETGNFLHNDNVKSEQGISGIISRHNEGVLELLLQIKDGPGNSGPPKISPTVQTREKDSIPYLWEFQENHDGFTNIVSRTRQSESGIKFYKSSNYNIHVHSNDIEALSSEFEWYTLSDIRTLLSADGYVNTSLMAALSAIDFLGEILEENDIDFNKFETLSELEKDLIISYISDKKALWKFSEIREWIANHKENKSKEHSLLSLKKLPKAWNKTSTTISCKENREFELMAVETLDISQPIVKDNLPKVYGLILKKINGILHVYAQLVEEDFSYNGPELGPSIIQVDDRDEKNPINIIKRKMRVIYDSYQSDEGDMFMECTNRYMMFIDDKNSTFHLDDFQSGAGLWLTINQFRRLLNLPCMVNEEARSLLTIASYYDEDAFIEKVRNRK